MAFVPARALVVATSLLFFSLMGISAQQPADAAPGGVVTGVITCGDTQRPARFASMTLMPVPDDKPVAKPISDKEAAADPTDLAKKMREQMSTMTVLHGQSGLDGTYTVQNVPPGDYYLAATQPGYVPSIAVAQAAIPTGASGRKLFEGVPIVHVEANRTAHGDITLERGAAISGTVAFDDGSPVAVMVMLLKTDEKKAADGEGANMFGGMAMMFAGAGGKVAMTDDRGHFRLAGLSPGSYFVSATLQVGAGFSMRAGVMDSKGLFQASPLTMYSPGTLHKTAATKITLAAGEERGDVNISVDLTGMHSVSGRIASAVDHHGVNEGSVALKDATDADFVRTAAVDATGAFTVGYVPAGTYTLEVTGAGDSEAVKKKSTGSIFNFASSHTLKSYDEASQALVVGASDVAGVNIELKESKTVKKDVDMNELLKQ